MTLKKYSIKHALLSTLGVAAILTPFQNAHANDEALLSIGAGYFDILDEEDAADFRLEYRSGHAYVWGIKPWTGIEVTSDASLWIGAGLLADIDLSENIYLTPSLGAGYYARGSSDLDLSSALEFRSQIELNYKLENGHRIGLAGSHISNAGITNSNSGTEILNLYYHIPVSDLF